ncbi:MAG: hypothetical protein WCA19_06480 [Candidatus Acidiferrales bacterium]
MGHLLAARRRHGELIPFTGWSKPAEIEERAAVQRGAGDPHDSSKADERLFVNFVLAQEIRVVAKVPQAPAEFPDCFGSAVEATVERKKNGYATPEECKAELLRQVASEINYLIRYQKIESKRREVEILRQRVPDSPGLDRLLRYESTLERAFDRTLTQLERAQRMRKEQPLPPQLDIRIS